MLFLSALAHHSEPGDPTLFDWMKHQIDAVVGLGPAAIVTALGALVIAIPIGILLFYFLQRARQVGS